MVVVIASWNAFELQMQVVSLREQPDEPSAAAAASRCLANGQIERQRKVVAGTTHSTRRKTAQLA